MKPNKSPMAQLNEQDQQLLMEAIYQTFTPEQQQAFDDRLASDLQFAQAYNQELELNSVNPIGSGPFISDRQLDANQFALHKKLRQSHKTKYSWSILFSALIPTHASRPKQFGGMALTFCFGLFIAQSGLLSGLPKSSFNTGEQTALSFIQPDDYEITDLQLSSLNTESGDVQLTYSIASSTTVAGNINNNNIQNLLAASIQNEVSDATRLDVVELLQGYSATDSVRDALRYSLINDPNPGVRLMAAESLAKLAGQKDTRQTLLQALKADVNPGIRIQVYQALLNHLDDEETLDTIQNHSVQDSNPYIRDHASSLVKALAENSENQI